MKSVNPATAIKAIRSRGSDTSTNASASTTRESEMVLGRLKSARRDMRATCAVIGFRLVGQVMFAEETLSIRGYSERCVSYYARMYGVSPALVRAIIQIDDQERTADRFGDLDRVARPSDRRDTLLRVPMWKTLERCSTSIASAQPSLPLLSRHQDDYCLTA